MTTDMHEDPELMWTEVLVSGWGPLVRDAVVARVEEAMIGRRGILVRGVRDHDRSGSAAACIEEVHARVLDAVRIETGADLDELGSQAAWACYEDAWDRLAGRWFDGGSMVAVHPARHHEVREHVAHLTVRGAEHAGADTGPLPALPLEINGAVLVDVQGLMAYIARDDGSMGPTERSRVDVLLRACRP